MTHTVAGIACRFVCNIHKAKVGEGMATRAMIYIVINLQM